MVELELEVLLLRNKIAVVIEDEFVKEINRLVHKDFLRTIRTFPGQ